MFRFQLPNHFSISSVFFFLVEHSHSGAEILKSKIPLAHLLLLPGKFYFYLPALLQHARYADLPIAALQTITCLLLKFSLYQLIQAGSDYFLAYAARADRQ